MFFFSFEFVFIVNYIDGFPYIKPSLHPRDEAYLIMVNDRFDVFLDSVCKEFLSIFASMLISEIGLKFSFLVWSLCGLGMRVIVALKNALDSVASDSILLNSLESICVRSLINV